MDPARKKARNEWYATLSKENRGLWYTCQQRETEISLEQNALPRSERMTKDQVAEVVDRMTTRNSQERCSVGHCLDSSVCWSEIS